MEFDSAALCGCVESSSTKRSVSLHPRLEAAAALLGKTSVLADIGCDHGRFSAAMLQRGIAEKVIASDISAPSLKKPNSLRMCADFQARWNAVFRTVFGILCR